MLLNIKKAIVFAVAAIGVTAYDSAPLAQELSLGSPLCHVGAYRLDDGRIIDVGPSEPGLRWRSFEGETGKLVQVENSWRHTRGWTEDADLRSVRFATCQESSITFNGVRGERVRLQVQETVFTSSGEQLHGRLILPPGDEAVPIVVLLHGAERDSAISLEPLQRLLPAAGIGAFVYDKRGTGASDGSYTQDFFLLAGDAVAAQMEARRLAGERTGRVGYHGPSQGGWVAPIAASQSSVDFVIVSFGLAVSVLEEDLEAVRFQMGLKGHDQNSIDRAVEIARAAGRVFESGFTEGVPEFEAVRERYSDKRWYPDVHGNFTGVMLGLSSEELRTLGPQFRWGTPFRYDPELTISALNVPQLWILGGQDIDAPVGETVRRLEALIQRGRPIALAVYPTAEHGLTEFETSPDGQRQSTRYATQYFEMIRDFARDGTIGPSYGEALITQ